MAESQNIYFETSAVNYLFDNVFNDNEACPTATKSLQLKKGRRLCISSITLWEIFLTKNETRRFELFDFARHIFFDALVPSPEEIIINYINSGCPIVETRYELNSQSLFSKDWTKACLNFSYYFQPDSEQINDYTHHFRTLGEYFRRTEKGFGLVTYQEFENSQTRLDKAYLEYIYNSLIKEHGRKPNEIEKQLIFIALQMTMIFLCFGIGFDQRTLENFWITKKQPKPLERLEYALKTFPDIFFRGPISNISKMIILQSKIQSSRGLYFDSLHSIYTTYCDLYFTNDIHFLTFKKENARDPNMHKVLDIKNVKFFKAG